MWKFCVFLFTVLLIETVTSSSLCSVRKSENKCICKRVSEENQSSIVTEADCASISLQHFPSQDQLTDDLNLLDLSHNELRKLDENDNKFSSSTLETLLLPYNEITYISDGFFQNMSNLEKLVLSHNNITNLDSADVFKDSVKLIYLDLSFNHIKTISVNIFSPSIQLQYLDLSYNNRTIGDWLSQSPDALSSNLGLSSTVTTLNLDNLGLKDLHNFYFDKYTNLKRLSLADNDFQEVPKIPSSVEYLDLSGSGISTLQAKHLSFYSVKTLKFDRMKKLESIHPYAFYTLQALEDLSIRNCHNLKEFNEVIFGVLHKNMITSLKRMSLAGNALQSLNSTYKFLFRMMDFVDLTDNPWNCNCDLLWLQEFDNLYRSENIKCSSPFRVSSKAVIDIVAQDLPNCYPEKYGKRSHRVLITILAVLVITLSALVAYLIYYAPNWYNLSRRIGPQSPYNSARTDIN